LLLPVASKLQQHQLAGGIDEVGRIERAALGFPARRRFLEERLVTEESDALLDRPILRVQADADDEARQAYERLGELAELERVIATAETGFQHHVFAVVSPAFDVRGWREHCGPPHFRVDTAKVLIVE